MKTEHNTPFGSSWHLLAFSLLLVASSLIQPSLALANIFGGDEPLAPEIAFKARVDSVSNDRIDVAFTIADGYYLYRDKLAFSVESLPEDPAIAPAIESQLTLGTPLFAEATTIEDDFFGAQSIFRQATLIALPYQAATDTKALMLSVKFQGCADIGLCYPPTTVQLPVELPASTYPDNTKEETSNDQSTLLPGSDTDGLTVETTRLSDVLGSSTDEGELLPPELAYLPQIDEASERGINVSWFIEEGYYLYRDKLSFTLAAPGGLDVGRVRVSRGVEQIDEFFGNVSVLRHSALASIELDANGDAAPDQFAGTEAELTINYQGCADIGVCFPPSQVTLPVSFSTLPVTSFAQDSTLIVLAGNEYDESSAITPSGVSTATASSENGEALLAQSEQDRLSTLLGASSLWLTVATFFGLGLLLAFTPCVLPMIPILSSLIVGQGKDLSTGRAFQLSLVYVLVMASTYAVVGIFVGLSGYNVQAFLQNPIVLSAIAVLFILLSLSMFGFYELQMPQALQNRLMHWSNRQGGGQIGGVAAMGFISTLIVGPCVTAPLAGALIYIAKTGDAFVGGAALFALGLGMGAPLLLIGTSAGKLVPKSGSWMNSVKYVFGVLMLCMAVYMVSRFLPTTVTMALYGILAVMSGIYLGATDSLSSDSSGWHRFGKGAGVVVAIYGLALLVGALAGGGSYTRPLGALADSTASSGGVASDHALPFQRVKSVENLQDVVAQASALGRPVMLDFYADWCISCKEMEAFTFTDERVQALLSTAVVVQADVTANDAQDQALLKEFDLFGPPGIIFYDATGSELPAARVVGFMNADKFSAHIKRFISRADS